MTPRFGGTSAPPPTQPDHGSTASGLDANVAATLAYSVGWVTGLALLFFEEENEFVRFHALQSVILFGGLSLAWVIAMSVPFLGWIVAFLVILPVSLFLWLLLMFKAYQGVRYKVPGAGDMAEQRL